MRGLGRTRAGAGARLQAISIATVLTILALAACLAPAAQADSSLAGEWHMDLITNHGGGNYTTPDSSGNGADLQVYGATGVTGRWGQAAAFNGANGDALSTSASQLMPAHITTMAWVKASSSPGSDKAILSQGGISSCAAASYALYTGSGGGVQFYIATGSSTTINSAAAASSLWDGNWHAVAGTFDGSTVRLYVDGQEVGSPTPATGAAIDYSLPDHTFDVGNFHACSGFAYTGDIDEVRVYDRALGAAEIAELQAPAATSPPELGADPTSTNVNCAPGTTTVGTPVTCTATVTDRALAPEAAPSGHVAFSSDSPGAFAAPGSTCTLTPAVGTQSGCHVTYTPSAVGSALHTITAAYASDATDGASSGTAHLGVTAGGGPTGPTGVPAPVASFTGPATAVHAAALTTLNASATTGATQLIWSVNGKPTASCSAQTPDLGIQIKRTSAVTLTALGPGGSSSTTRTVPAILKSPAPSGGVRFLSTAVCSGGSSAADVTAGGGPPAGCTTSVTEGLISAVGCFSNVTNPAQVPAGEAAILTALETDYQSDGSFQAAAGWFCQNIASCRNILFGTRVTPPSPGSSSLAKDITLPPPGSSHLTPAKDAIVFQTAGLYVSTRTVRINGVDFTPLAGAAIVISPGFGRVVSADAAVRVGGVPIKIGQINLDVADHCKPSCGNGTIPIASFDSRGLPDAGDFPFSGQADISLVAAGTDHYSEIHGQVTLPPVLGSATVSGTLRADNTNGITLQNFHAHLDSLGYQGIGLTDVDIYFQTPGNWAFYGNIGIGTAVIRLVPTTTYPLNGVVFVNGSLDHAGATLDLTDDPPEIAPGVQLDTISLSFALNPTALRGAVTLNALGVADVNGRMVLGFPSQNAQFTLQPSDLPGAPQSVLGQSYSQSPVIGVGGQVAVTVPDVGDLALGSGYLLYAYPGYIAAGGQIDHDFFGVIKFDGGVNGELNVVNKRFNLGGHVYLCLEDLGCATVDAVVSSHGVGACFGDEGGGFRWHDFPTPHIDINVFGVGSSCDISSFSEAHVFAAADARRAHAASATVHAVTLRRGQKPYVIRLDGAGGAPNVSVTGPGGQSLSGTAAGIHRSGGIIVVQSEMSTETVLGIKPTVPGRYTITLLAGPAVTHSYQEIQHAPARVTGHVTGTGPRRVLHYRVDAPGEQVTLLQVAHGVSREIGTASGRGGALRFTTEPGSDARMIEARLSADNGIPSAGAMPIVVARFRGPRFVRPGRVTRLTARWHGAILTVDWHAASEAVRYTVTVHERGGALTRIATRARVLRLRDLHPTLKGAVTVVAISADGDRGAAVSASYRAAHAATSRFLPFSELKAKPRKHRG